MKYLNIDDITAYGAITNYIFVSGCEEECILIKKYTGMCSIFINGETLIEVIQKIEKVINFVSEIYIKTGIEITIITVFDISSFINKTTAVSIKVVKNIKDIIKIIDDKLYYYIEKNTKSDDNNEVNVSQVLDSHEGLLESTFLNINMTKYSIFMNRKKRNRRQ